MRGLSLILIFCLLSASQVFAQADAPDVLASCGRDAAALRTAIGADGWVVDDLIQIRWSPNCNYVSMRVPSSHGDPGKTIVWDAAANKRVGVLEGFAQGGSMGTTWDWSGEYLVIPTDDVGTYLWHMPSDQPMLINSFECGLLTPYWDYEHGRLYATAPIEWGDNWCSAGINVGDLRVYDLNTGETIATYPIEGFTLAYKFSEDGRFVVISGYPAPVQVRDRASGNLIAEVDVNQGGGVVHSADQIALSPDGRYLALGLQYLRIWDLANLPADLDAQQPAYRYAVSSYDDRVRKLRFIDNQTIETVNWSGTTHQWDITTGAEVR